MEEPYCQCCRGSSEEFVSLSIPSMSAPEKNTQNLMPSVMLNPVSRWSGRVGDEAEQANIGPRIEEWRGSLLQWVL